MVYGVQFPSELTEEEKALKEAYEKLRRVKKLYQLSKARKPEAEPSTSRPQLKRGISDIEDAERTTEQLKQLVKSGGVTIQKVAEKHSFKRAKQPDRKSKDETDDHFQSVPTAKKMFGDFNSEVSSSAPPYARSNLKTSGDDSGTNGTAIYVRAMDLREEILRKTFARFGLIVSLHLDERRRNATIAFEMHDQAVRASKEMNGSMIGGITLQVGIARSQTTRPNVQQRQPWQGSTGSSAADSPNRNLTAAARNDRNSRNSWSEIAAGGKKTFDSGGISKAQTSASSVAHARDLVTYDETNDFV